jgi:hypothetical protein
MSDRIQKPLKSERLVLILNRILEMEEPYLSKLSEHLHKPVGEVQTYTETMVEKGWLTKEKEGRKSVFKFQPAEVWRDYPKLGKLGQWNELEDNTQEFLKFALHFKIIYSVSETKGSVSAEEGWVEATDIHMDSEESVYLRPLSVLDEILQENIDTILTIEALLDELGLDEKRGVDKTFSHELAYVRAYLKMNTGEWDEEDIKDFTQTVEENPYDYG